MTPQQAGFVRPAEVMPVATRTAIEWTEVTWNPTTGCDRISAGCDNCYALTLAKRLKAMGADKYQIDGDPRSSGPGFGLTVHRAALRQPHTWTAPRLVFVNSMSDLFHARVPLGFVRDAFAVIADTPQHTYQVLTKRSTRLRKVADRLDWPANLWMGVSVENAATLPRVDDLRGPPCRSSGGAVRLLRAAARAARRDQLGRHRLGDRRGRVGAAASADGSRVGRGFAGSLRRCARAVLLQAMGRPDAEGRWPAARRTDLGSDARPGVAGYSVTGPGIAMIVSRSCLALPTTLTSPAASIARSALRTVDSVATP
jgi:hypothetical protein